MVAEIFEPNALTEDEKKALTPCLVDRGLSPDLLDLLTNVPEKTKLVKVHSEDGELLGVTNVLVTPSIFMKHCFGPGNHIGTNSTFYFSKKENRAPVLAAMLKKLVELRPYGHYVGFVDDDLTDDFRRGLDGLHYVVAEKVMEMGSIAVSGVGAEEALLKKHRHLKRHLSQFQKSGGSVHVHEGRVEGDLATEIVDCCLRSYRKNTHPGVPIDISSYGDQILDFLSAYANAVTIFAKVGGQMTGVQIFLRHARHLELTEGGFAAETFRSYENILLESVRYCEEHALERVSYGLILNETKDRFMDKETRKPIFLLMLFQHPLDPETSSKYRTQAHERFDRLFWKDRSQFSSLPL